MDASAVPSPLDCPIVSINVRVWRFWSFILRHNFMRYISVIPVGVMTAFMFTDLYRAWGNIDEVIINAFFAVLWFNALIRGMMLIHSRETYEGFLGRIAVVYKEIEALKDETIQDLAKKLTTTARKISFANLALGAFISAGYVVYPLFAEGRRLPYGMYLPGFDHFQSPQYELLYLAQVILTFPGCCMYIPYTSFFVTCSLFGQLQIKIVQHQLRELQTDKAKIESRLVSIIKRHQQVIIYVRELNSLVTYICMMELVSFGTMLCALLFLLVIIDNFAQVAIVMSYIFMLISQIMAFYWYGNEIREESMAIALAAYSGPWLELDTKIRKIVLLIILRAQRPLQITVGNVYPMTLEMFQSLLNASYSYFTLLKRVYS
ncbi:odorant receptor Or2-like [Wyeomyia smithii]|uniref:odorant receptor Or2-like n=1 Tax=Wyeomyia smithii TaxID=174621 RepID=UPI002467F621|nr:odorant receptor Or2-like [Wyeomyia smithii]